MEQPVQTPAQPAQGKPDPAMINIYQRLALAAMKIIYDPKVSQQLVQTMKTAGDPAAAVSHVATVVISQLRQQSKGIPPETANAIAPMVVAMLFEVGHAAGLFKTVDKNMVTMAVDLFKKDAEQPAQPAATPQAAPPGLISSGAAQPAAMVQ